MKTLFRILFVLSALCVFSPQVEAAQLCHPVSSAPDYTTVISNGNDAAMTCDSAGNLRTTATLSGGTVTATTAPTTVTPTDKGGTITLGGTAQNAIASNSSRKGWCIQNDPAETETLNVRVGGTASATTGFSVMPGQQVCNPTGLISTGAVSVYAATTGHRWFGVEVQ